MALLVEGAIVPLDPGDPERHGPGWVRIDDAGLVAATGFGRPRVAEVAGARRVSVGRSWVFPGVIDLHNHIGYNTLPLWTEPSQTTPFLHHNDWTDEPTYQSDVTWPAQTLATCAPEALMAYVEVKALVGGTTAIQGSPQSNRPRDSWLVRNVDEEEFGTGDRNLIYTSVLTLAPPQLRARAVTLTAGRGFIYHCAEGQPGSVVAREYTDVRAADCLQERLIGVHCTAVTDFSAWSAKPGAVVWSPFSNLWLYGVTTDVSAARAAGLLVCVGSDWAPSGTKHVLGEIKVADLHNQSAGLGLTERELVQMVTANPGDALSRSWPHAAGRTVPGALGDLTIVSRRSANPWRDLIDTREKDVRLVVVDGQARYGMTTLMARAGATPTGPITVAGMRRTISIPHPDDPTRHWPWAQVRAALEQVRADPAAALAAADARAGAHAAAGGPPELELTLDMPSGGGDQVAGPPREPGAVVIPPLDGLTHDARWLATIPGRGFHGGALDGLETFYS
jgi:5-methylthioadenosine/S-adenosylhomocysteine deaminase